MILRQGAGSIVPEDLAIDAEPRGLGPERVVERGVRSHESSTATAS